MMSSYVYPTPVDFFSRTSEALYPSASAKDSSVIYLKRILRSTLNKQGNWQCHLDLFINSRHRRPCSSSRTCTGSIAYSHHFGWRTSLVISTYLHSNGRHPRKASPYTTFSFFVPAITTHAITRWFRRIAQRPRGHFEAWKDSHFSYSVSSQSGSESVLDFYVIHQTHGVAECSGTQKQHQSGRWLPPRGWTVWM
jgi:hypothetical protein